ncbi:MAG TPA: NADH-quinone oxidoreductase subunit L [Syntrophorhabdaceae bacterium]|jgi:NADH-quinone oxidoreductase subunit L
MIDSLWLIPAWPLAGFVILTLFGSRFPRNSLALLGATPSALSAITASLVMLQFMNHFPGQAPYTLTLWMWLQAGGFSPSISFLLDPLSLTMVLVVSWVGFLILLYSVPYMAGEIGYGRFFAHMNLFVASMLLLVLADNLLLLYLGWEGVGLCSYLLIGFWYQKEENMRAAFKAFFITRIGDVALVFAIFIIYHNLGTLNIQDAMATASADWRAGSATAIAVASLILAGALGKSAQLPLQTWLPDAMAGPTPVSALIHAATMVTAGVYLIARTHIFFSLAPAVQLIVAALGAATILLAGSSALVQRDIKRLLAYSTMSQIGYMFLALGVGAWVAAVFHLVIHAFSKALLFLSAGLVIQALGDERDISRMGGLRKALPLAFWTFFIGSASLAAIPFITGGFFSKEMILSGVWTSPIGGPMLLVAGLAGALITSVYIFRPFFIIFFGKEKGMPEKGSHPAATISLVILSALALMGGYVETPPVLGGVGLFSRFMEKNFPLVTDLSMSGQTALIVLSLLTSLGGIFLAYVWTTREHGYDRDLARAPLGRFLYSGWGFDRLYAIVFVTPFLFLAQLNRNDFLDLWSRGIGRASVAVYRMLCAMQTGNVRWYATFMVLGAIVLIGMVIFL